MKITANKVSTWAGIFGIPLLLAGYLSGYQSLLSSMRAGPRSPWPDIFIAAFVMFTIIMLIANAVAHSNFDKLLQKRTTDDAKISLVDRPQFQSAEEFYKKYDNALLAEGERLIQLDSNRYQPGPEREKFLIRTLVTTFIIGLFEQINSNIFGSQIKALQELASSPSGLKTDSLRHYFEDGLLTVPEQYRNRTFDLWLSYLRDSFLIAQHADVISVTIRGKEFLKYMIDRSYPINRPG